MSNLVLGFNPHQVAELARRAITPEQALAAGVRPVQTDAERPDGTPGYWTVAGGYLPGLLYPLVSPTPGTAVQWQLKPDVPKIGEDGAPRKYLFPKGFQPVLNVIRRVAAPMRSLLVEGTNQAIAAAVYAPEDCDVYGISGCWSWQSGGTPTNDLLTLAAAGDAVVILDADAGTNLQVYNAGVALGGELLDYGVQAVSFGVVNGRGNDGLDDVLGKRPVEVRAAMLARLIREAGPKPAPTKPTAAQESKRQAASARKEAELEEARTDHETGLARFDISRPKGVVINDLVRTLADRLGGEHMFNRGNVLTQREGRALKIVNRDVLLDAVSQLLRPGRANAQTGAWDEQWPDLGIQGVVLQRYDSFPELEQVVAAPFARLDGSICQTNGYDPASSSYVLMDGALAGLSVPDEPDAEQVASAVKLLLDEWLGDFPFPEQSDRANVLAFILTPFVRQFMDVVPIAVVDGNGPSAGKGLLAEVVSRLVLGTGFTPTALPRDNEEMRKQITSTMLEGHPLAIWDEAHVLEGTALAQLLTAPTWSDRKLGVSQMVSIPNRVTWAALGNNVRVNGDIARRAYRVRISPTGDNPESRDVDLFRHPNLKEWTEEHRGELVAAVLTLVRAWHVAGRPKGRADIGSFERWSRTLGGILQVAGVTGFLEGTKEWREGANETGEVWARHMQWLEEEFGEGCPFTSSEVVRRLGHAGLDVAPPSSSRELANPDGTPRYVSNLGLEYVRHLDRPTNGLLLVRQGAPNHRKWVILKVGSGGAPEGVLPLSSLVQGSQGVTESNEPIQDGEGRRVGEGFQPMRYVRNISGPPEGVAYVSHVGEVVVDPPAPLLPSPTPETGVTVTVSAPRLDIPAGTLTDPGSWISERTDALLVAASLDGYVSRCEQGHPEVLVDGLWFACPICYPGTTRSGLA